MDYMEKIDGLLYTNMTERSFLLWKGLKEKIPDVWQRLSSSTGKYHRRRDSTVPSIAEHTHEMLVACVKLLSIFNISPKSLDSDILLFSVVLHDSFKYGIDPTNSRYTNTKHDQLIGDIIRENKSVFMRIFTEEQVCLLEKCTRYHPGRWSSDSDVNFSFSNLPVEVFFLHILDMLSTADLLSVGEENGSK